jgi:2,5-diketo-D-gluconate reductase A
VPGVWRQFIDAKASNPHIRHIGVSNFRLDHLEELLEAGLPMPEVNQIEFHPGFYQGIRPLLAFHREHRILTAGYSPVGPLQGGKPAPAFLQEMADRHKATPAQILLAWAKGKGVTVVM